MTGDFMDILINLVSTLGIPTAIILLILVVVGKFLPDFLKLILKSQADSQQYNLERRKATDEQMNLVSQLLGETHEILSRNTEIIKQNSDILKNHLKIDENILSALSEIDGHIVKYAEQLKDLDKMLVKMNTDIRIIVATINSASKGVDSNPNNR